MEEKYLYYVEEANNNMDSWIVSINPFEYWNGEGGLAGNCNYTSEQSKSIASVLEPLGFYEIMKSKLKRT